MIDKRTSDFIEQQASIFRDLMTQVAESGLEVYVEWNNEKRIVRMPDPDCSIFAKHEIDYSKPLTMILTGRRIMVTSSSA